MYRIIAPVVDVANESQVLVPYFEYNQKSAHGTHQSVDIALLNEASIPVVLIEAKRADRKVTPEQIAKYLEPGVRGVVTNGFTWILCDQNEHEVVQLFDDGVNAKALQRIIAFIRSGALVQKRSNTTESIYSHRFKPERIVNKQKINRNQHPVDKHNELSSFRNFVASVDTRPESEATLLKAILDGFDDQVFRTSLGIETRDTRVTFSNSSLPHRESRLARIELGKKHPDILVRTWIVNAFPVLAEIATPTIHDKGAHMRRFRLGSTEEAHRFGTALVHTLRVCAPMYQ